MSEDGYKKLYEAQCKEHEKTHARLRVVEKENANLRSLVGSQQRDYEEAVAMLQDVAANINKAFLKRKK